MEFREIGLEKLFHGNTGLGDKHAAYREVMRRPVGTFILRWSTSNMTYCITVRDSAENAKHRLVYRPV